MHIKESVFKEFIFCFCCFLVFLFSKKQVSAMYMDLLNIFFKLGSLSGVDW